jgi:carbamoyl-phosphate synthase large subunit
MTERLTVAVTGLNATESPAPGVGVIRALREAYPGIRIIGLAYDPLDPGNFMPDIADVVYLMPYPSQGADVTFERLRGILAQDPIDVILPTLDAELPVYLKLREPLLALGVKSFLPTEAQLSLRSKAKFHELGSELGIPVPHSMPITDANAIPRLSEHFPYPLMVKGQFYEASIAYSPMEVESHFNRLRAKWGLPIIIQEFIAGEEFDVVAVGDGQGGLIGHVPMRKMQLTDKGKAWGGITIADRALDAFAVETMKKIGWRGPLELEVMKAKDTGKYYLLEINPRFPAWVYLAVGAGCNLPAATVALALGRPVKPFGPAPAGIMFLRYSYDWVCSLADYEQLTVSGHLRHDKVKST